MEEVAYVPTMTTNPEDAEIRESFSAPPYDDVGISYKGYSKTKVSSSKWQLNRQETQFTSMKIVKDAFDSNLFTRKNPDKTFYVTGIKIHWDIGSGIFPWQVHIADVDKDGHSEIRFYDYLTKADHHHTFISLKDCPRKFSGKYIDLYTQCSLGTSDMIHFELFGWIE